MNDGCEGFHVAIAVRPRSLEAPKFCVRMKFRTLYPTGTSRAAGQLVRGRATIHYEEFGRADGVPALFLHGGPGAGCFPRHASFFDPVSYTHLTLPTKA